MDAATAHDYLWFEEEFPSLAEAYCLTLVRGLTPQEALEAFGAQPRDRGRGVRTVEEFAYEAWNTHDGQQGYVAAAALGDWTVAVEPNGYLATLDSVLDRLSAGRTLVSLYRNVNAVTAFRWYEDDEVRLDFDPLFAYDRDGSEAEAVADDMRAVGFELREDADPVYDLVGGATFALAERITGVRVTGEFLETAGFVGGLAPVPAR
ncbi:DUF6461 domain-containing protein [Streptomyces sp. NPDC051940]|uniref:DUF6461 domain-containing protein n=1 Tax=Streptomyces sp. NPDC051940 TaxID=3155675 RepID=UPI00343DCF56